MAAEPPEGDRALLALRRLLAVVELTERDFAAIRERAAHIENERAAGRRYHELVADEDPPLIVQVMTKVLDQLSTAGADWRREEARALHREGVSMDRIAALFGVTRQRVSALLAGAAGGPAD